jgi:RNA polymerase sigma-70 factor (ECF subfamily)
MTYPLLELWVQSGNEHDTDGPRVLRREAHGARRESHSLPDASLLARIRVGDQSALGALYEATFHDLWVFARRYVGAELAEEIVQDVFLRVWTRPDLTIQTTLRAYLFGAVRHHALNMVHRATIESHAQDIMTTDAAMAAADLAPDSAARAELRSAIARTVVAFPERQRAAIILRIDRELSYAEIGDILGISATAAGNLVKKGEVKLRIALRAFRPETPSSLDAELSREGVVEHGEQFVVQL